MKIENWPNLNITQELAVKEGLLDSTSNFVVIAPTSSGKTGVAQLAALQALEGGQKVAYLVPMKPLISEKEEDFKGICNDVAGHEASPSDWEKAKVVITTFESFYKSALTSPDFALKFGLAIIDEFHVLYDKLRGFNLEKVITLLKEFDTRLICLSATFEDKNEIGAWLNAKVVTIPDEARKVKIEHDIIDLSNTNSTKQNEELCKILLRLKKEPYLVFCTMKESTISRAQKMCSLLDKLVLDEKSLRDVFSKTLSRRKLTKIEEQLLSCMQKGVAFHHSGLDRRLRSLVEKFFANRAISYLFATPGLAYGVNLPAKTVVVADTSFYDPDVPGKRQPVEVYMYIQMAGRAGRPGFGDEGYAYVVQKKGETSTVKYRRGKIERAISRIGIDDYFRKTILELIYSKRCRDEEILSFFKNTFYNFQSEREKVQFIPFDLFKILKKHVEFLYENGFIEHIGAPGYRLAPLGEVTISFLFGTFVNYPLTPFVELNKFLDKDNKVRTDDFVIWKISGLFDGACLSKVPRERSEKVCRFFESKGVPLRDQGPSEYSAYAIYYGWMENQDLADIEENFKVFASQCPEVGIELYRLLTVYEKLALKKGIMVPEDFKDFKDRVRYGVTAEELPLRRLRGIGRGTTRKIKMYCENFLRKTPWNMKGPIIEVLEQIYVRDGEKRFTETLQYIKGIGKGKKHEKILELVKTRVNKKGSAQLTS